MTCESVTRTFGKNAHPTDVFTSPCATSLLTVPSPHGEYVGNRRVQHPLPVRWRDHDDWYSDGCFQIQSRAVFNDALHRRTKAGAENLLMIKQTLFSMKSETRATFVSLQTYLILRAVQVRCSLKIERCGNQI